ncbi:WD40-repeat-containing domain protein [Trametes elegans]|nr:WD40-repeat-containing domain protein [Trametes elegans]
MAAQVQVPFPTYDDDVYEEDSASTSRDAREEHATPRFSYLLTSVLGSPFLTTSELPEDADTAYAPSIPMDAMDVDGYTDNGTDMEAVDGAFATVPRALTVTRPPSPTPSFRTDAFSIVNWNPELYNLILPPGADGTPRCSMGFLPVGRRTVSGYPQWAQHSTPSPSPIKASRSLTIGMGILPRIWDALREGTPEGELIDDEACFIDVRAITGMDILSHLPLELALDLLSNLDLPSILACLRVSRTWNHLARDNSIWRILFSHREKDGWRVDLRRANHRNSTSKYGALPSHPLASLPAPLEIKWYELYRTRTELDRRWSNYPGAGISADLSDGATAEKEAPKAWEPKVMRISGHGDSVYCLEFDSSRIVTGSRDRTIKVWSLKTGRCLATFSGHRGSVLCLKFDRDWDIADDVADADAMTADDVLAPRKGFMVSGSSDCSVCVWDLYAHPKAGAESEITAEVKAILRGHSGGVLDLRIDAHWIVSCSKDALIRVWNRKTLELHCTLRGHEGPVNAVGLQGNRVVSASGDGKMILWDVGSGERLRTFEGHERGLACIEFKEDLIVSGSNDCKIKVWDANTGTCLRTLVGHDYLVRALAFDPRSGRLVSGSYDKTVKVWDLHTGKLVREFRGCHVSHIFDVKFDQCRIVSTSHDRKIVVLDFSEGLDTSLFV